MFSNKDLGKILAKAAAEKKWELICNAIAQQRIDVNYRFERGNTLLHLLCREQKSTKYLHWLLAQPNLQLTAENQYHCQPLAVAISYAGVEVLELLLKYETGIGKLDFRSCSPLACALLAKNPERNAVIELLFAQSGLATDLTAVRHKININEQFACGRTLLHYAVFHKKDALIIWLLEQAELHVDLPDQFARPALFDAIRHNRQVATVQHLIDRGANCNYRNKYGFTPLYWACMHADETIIACLLQQPELHALESLHKALADGCLERNDGFKQENLLDLATKTGRQDVVDWLLLNNFCQDISQQKAENYRISAAEIKNGLEAFSDYLNNNDADSFKSYYRRQLKLLAYWPKNKLREFLRVTYQLAERAGDVLELKTYLQDAVEHVSGLMPIGQMLNFYLNIAALLLQQGAPDLAVYCYTTVLNNSTADSTEQQQAIERLQSLELKLRYQQAKPLISKQLADLQLQQDYAAIYKFWQQSKQLLAAERAVCIEQSLFKEFSQLLKAYAADYLHDSDPSKNLPTDLLARAYHLLEQINDLDNNYNLVASYWLEQILDLKSSLTAQSYQELQNKCAKISGKFDLSPSPVPVSQLALGVGYRERLKVLRADFATDLSMVNIIEKQQCYSQAVMQLIKDITQQVSLWLGAPPCAYALLGFGSIARQSLAPYSDIDCAILIADPAHKSSQYFSALVLSIDAVLQTMAEPCILDNKQAVRRGVHLDNLAKIDASANQQLLLNTPAGLARFVVSSATSSDLTEQGFAFALLSPCLLYAAPGCDLFASYCFELSRLLDPGQLGVFWQLVRNTLSPRTTQPIDVKDRYLNPLLYLISLATLAYEITTPDGYRLEARPMSVLEQLARYWHTDYLKQLRTDLQSLCLLRAKQHFLQGCQADVIYEEQYVASLLPWQGLAALGYEFKMEESFNPLLLYAKLFNSFLDSKPAAGPLIAQLQLGAASLVQLATAELYPIYLRLNNDARTILLQAMPEISEPERSWYQTLPDRQGVSLSKEMRSQAWQETLLQLTEEYRPGKRPEYEAQARVMLEWFAMQGGQAISTKRLLPVNYQWQGCDYRYCNLDGDFNEQQLLEHGLFLDSTRHKLIKLPGAYLKLYPESPGVQFQVDSLSQRISGSDFHTTLVRITPLAKPTQYFPALFSQAVTTTLDASDLRQVEARLNGFYFSLKVFEAIIMRPEDDKPDNLGISQLNDGSYRLISFDADHAFYPATVERGSVLKERKLQLKTIVFCFKQMLEAINSEARELFLSLDAYALLKDFLQELYVDYQAALFSRTEILEFLEHADQSKKIWLANAFVPGEIAELYQRIKRLQAALQDPAVINNLDLVARIEPLASDYYATVQQQFNSPSQRWEALLPRTEYKPVPTQCRDRVMQQSMLRATERAKASITIISEDKFIQQRDTARHQIYNPRLATAELEGIEYQYQSIAVLVQDLQQSMFDYQLALLETLPNNEPNNAEYGIIYLGPDHYLLRKSAIEVIKAKLDNFALKTLRANLKDKDLKQQLLDITQKLGFTHTSFAAAYPFIQEQTLKRLDFAQINPDMQVLKSLKNFRELHLRNCKVLDYPSLVTILENNPELRILSLTGCDNLKGDYYGSIDILSKTPHLEKLDLSDNKIEVLADWWGREWVVLKFSKLKRLSLRNCPQLKLIAIEAPSLERLEISNCQNLEEKVIQNLIQQSNRLTHLELIGFPDDFLCSTEHCWSRLSYIDLLSKDGDTALILAAREGLKEVCKQLIPRMSDAAINVASKSGNTALMCAENNILKEVCELLIPRMSNDAINMVDRYGRTALMLSVIRRLEKVCEMLISRISDTPTINAVDIYGNTALILAVREGLKEVCGMLIPRISDGVNAANEDGNTALILAARKGLKEVCEQLIPRMSDAAINAANKYGNTALSIARDRGHFSIVKLIEDYEAVKIANSSSASSRPKW